MKTDYLLTVWKYCESIPFGSSLFSFLIGFVVPYTGTLGVRVLHLEPGHSKLKLRDRWRVRNHLNSIHAMALANFAEATSGLAFISGLGNQMRAILVGFEIQYVKKARGTLTAECRVPNEFYSTHEQREILLPVEIRDSSGDVVVSAKAKWRVGPK